MDTSHRSKFKKYTIYDAIPRLLSLCTAFYLLLMSIFVNNPDKTIFVTATSINLFLIPLCMISWSYVVEYRTLKRISDLLQRGATREDLSESDRAHFMYVGNSIFPETTN